MKLLSLRRRYMILVPLAILLPAGLLTYLGYKTVQYIDLRVEKQVESIASKTRYGLRNHINQWLNYEILDSFYRDCIKNVGRSFHEKGMGGSESFYLDENLTYASQIFLLTNNEEFSFFERKMKRSHQWVIANNNNEQFQYYLKSTIQTKFQNQNPEMPIGDITERDYSPSDFTFVPYPEAPFAPPNSRKLAVFYLFHSMSAETSATGEDTWIQAVGFILNIDYFNQFLKESLQQVQPDEFSIAIYDRSTEEFISTLPHQEGIPFRPSMKYRPETFNESRFPWYMIAYSTDIGYQEKKIARNEKIVYSCLIAAAIIIMILGVIGTQRNIIKELELSEMRSDFVARVSHELRTPIGLIRLYSETLELNRMQGDGKRKEYLHAITKESERLSHLINNILDFSQIEANKKTYRLIEHPVTELICETANAMRYHFERNDMELQMDIEPRLPNILCDPEPFQQALYNILSNAMKYSGEGKEVRIHAYQKENWIRIDIVDQGIGIPKEHQKKIFHKFYRVDDPHVRKTGGSGLGLSVVNHIIENHNGTLHVSSKPGKGSTFTIQVPMVPNPQHIYTND